MMGEPAMTGPAHSVQLSIEEMSDGAFNGIRRRIRAIGRRRPAAAQRPDGNEWEYDIEAALAEKAFAKVMGLYWSGSADIRLPDVGDDWEVKWTKYESGDLIVEPDNPPSRRYVLLTGQQGCYTIRGWIPGWAAKVERYAQRSRTGRPGFWVPQNDLTPIDMEYQRPRGLQEPATPGSVQVSRSPE